MPWDDADLRFVGDVARALVDLDRVEGLLAFRLPYPAHAQHVLDRWVLRWLQEGANPPASVPGMVEYCQERPLIDWPLDLPDGVFTERSLLLSEEHGLLTDLCYEAALTLGVANPWTEILRVMDNAADLCRDRRDAQAYLMLRRFLAQTPVQDNDAATAITFTVDLGPLDGVVKELYTGVSSRWRAGGESRACAACHNLTVPVSPETWGCESDRCAGAGTDRAWFPVDGPLFHLDRVHRQFVSRPGQVLLNLAARLTECGVDVVAWPGYGAYDLRITFRDGHSLAVQLVDWSNPALAGMAAAPIAESPHAHERFRVVPAHRLDDAPDYIPTFERCQPVSDAVPLLSDTELITRVRHRGDTRARRSD